MIIYDLKVNGIKQPMGYNFERVRVSWKVKDFTDKYQANATVIFPIFYLKQPVKMWMLPV